MCDKMKAAEKLAQIHYESESTSAVYCYSASIAVENEADEPIKLLEVDEDTLPSGIVPLRFGPLPERGITYSSTIIEVTSEEYRQIEAGKLELPQGWEKRQHIRRLPVTENSGE